MRLRGLIRARGQKRARDAKIRELLWEWDPLGPEDPYDPHLPADEYDWMIAPLLDRLEAGAQPDEVAAFLTESARNRYGLEPDTTKTSKIAERVSALRREARLH